VRGRIEYFEAFMPRQLEIIYEIYHRFLDEVRCGFTPATRTGRSA